MKIQVVSDLHIEMKPYALHRHADADVLVLAGDIIALQNNCDKLYHLENIVKHINIPIVYVTGNHEYYGFGKVKQSNKIIKTLEQKYPHFHFLDNEVWIYNDVEFIGSTLWSDFDLSPNRSWFAEAVQQYIADFSQILSDEDPRGRMSGREMINLNHVARQFIDMAVRNKNGLKKVVVTHYVPTIESVGEQWKGNSLNPYFVCNCESLMPGVHTWIHGHTHCSFDYQLVRKHASGHVLVDTHIVCNPRGYDKENRNKFDGQKIIEV